MRHQYHLDERDLDECVRRQVITPTQREGLLAYVRTRLAETSVRGGPDFGWVSWAYLTVATIAVGVPGLLAMVNIPNTDPATVTALSMAAALVLGAVGAVLRRTASAHRAGVVLLTASLAVTWGIVAGAFAMSTRGSFALAPAYYGSDSYLTPAEGLRRALNAYVVGDVALIVTAIVGGRWLRLPSAALLGALAGLHLAGTLTQLLGTSFSNAIHPPIVAGMACAALLALATRLYERAARTARGDAPFWIHLVSLLVFGFGACVEIADAPVDAFGFLALALVWAVLGVAWRRPVYFAAAAVGVLLYPLIALECSRHSAPMGEAVTVLLISSVVVMLGTAIVRRASERAAERTPSGVDWSAESIWG